MPIRILISILAILVLSETASADKLVIYVYDSFTAKGALGPVISEGFGKKYGHSIEWVSFSSAGEALNQVALEKKKPRADVVVGVDNALVAKAKALDVFLCDQALVKEIPEAYRFDLQGCLIPFDYGYLAFLYDNRRFRPSGISSLKALAENETLGKKTVISDPRTSSLGLGFLLWTRERFGAAWGAFWEKFAAKIVTISPGWSGAYGAFLKGEADLVLSYTTSPAYHIEKEKQNFIRAILFEEGHYRQIEAVGIVRNSPRLAAAKQWVAYLLSPEIQKQVPLTQWMYPVNDQVLLPESFKQLGKKPKALELTAVEIEANKSGWLREWTRLISKAR